MYPARAFFLFGLMLLRGMAALLNSGGLHAPIFSERSA
jgi:hypothetical protein